MNASIGVRTQPESSSDTAGGRGRTTGCRDHQSSRFADSSAGAEPREGIRATAPTGTITPRAATIAQRPRDVTLVRDQVIGVTRYGRRTNGKRVASATRPKRDRLLLLDVKTAGSIPKAKSRSQCIAVGADASPRGGGLHWQ